MSFCYFNDVNPNHLARTSEQLFNHINKRQDFEFEKARKERDAINTPEQLNKYKTHQRALFINSIGGIPKSTVPLNPVVTSTHYMDEYKIENIIFTARQDVYVTGTMYIPNEITYPAPAVLFLSGHYQDSRMNPEYQKACVTIAKQGIIVFAFDPVGQGERISYLNKETNKSKIGGCTAEHDQAGVSAIATGKYIARYFLADEMRAIDYMLTRPEIDPARIGLTGNSGGGTQTSILMAMDDRIACAAPGTFISSRKAIADAGLSQDAEQIWPNATINGFDHISTIMMMAPKPVNILAVRYDFFPFEGTVDTYNEAKRFYDMFGKGDNLHLSFDYETHKYSNMLIEEAASFFALHLCGKKTKAKISNFTQIDFKNMYATKSGQVALDFPNAIFIQDETLKVATTQKDNRHSTSTEEQLKKAKTWLQERVYAYRNCTKDGFLKWMPDDIERASGCVGITAMWKSQKDLYGFALIITDEHFDPKTPRKTIVCIWDNGTKSTDKYEDYIVNKCKNGWRVIVLDVTGIGNLGQTPLINPDKNPRSRDNSLFFLGNELFSLNDSLAALRTFDVLRAIDVFEAELGVKRDDITLYADGIYGIYGTMAAFLDKSLKIEYGNGILKSIEADRIINHTQPFDDDFSLAIPGMTEYFDYNEIM